MIPSLPVEIVREIITFSLPEFEQSICAKRYDHLLSCMSVCSVWKELAEEELYRHIVVVPTSKSLELLAVEFNERPSLGLKAESLYIGIESFDYTRVLEGVATILMRCNKIRELWLVEFDFAMEVFVELMESSTLLYLESLHFIDCTTLMLEGSTYNYRRPIVFRSNPFLKLRHLTVMNCDFSGIPDDFLELLTTSILPLVTSFTFVQTKSELLASSLKEFNPQFFNQLKKVVLYDSYGTTENVFIRSSLKMDSLETLIIHDVNILHHKLASSFPNLSQLIIRNGLDGFGNDAGVLEAWLNENSPHHKIKKVIFPFYYQPHVLDPSNECKTLESINLIFSNVDCSDLGATDLLKVLHFHEELDSSLTPHSFC